MSIPAAAERLGVSDKTVRRLISEGKLPAYRIGAKTIRLRPEDVDALFVPVPTPTV
ncbi:helix-turn-helix domain-containing protein [Arsenicicoccus dermatophilus]|uniref:helix-turn-helix domain-containing protein n=1 Tax=Arsenicicoccus dermatophilus TaxID=1076331 RepID=UPI0024097946|nr:helix-turn-helix domain-containing protein [Arsenicicoccus dermatophilus]